MPLRYWVHCPECAYRAYRYRNVKHCPDCGSCLVREEGEQVTREWTVDSVQTWNMSSASQLVASNAEEEKNNGTPPHSRDQ